MNQWNGQGICYFPAYVSSTNLTSWHQYFQQYGITKVRMNYDWLENSGVSFANSKIKAIQAKSEGMHVTFGITQNSVTLTDTNITDYYDAIMAAAQWAQDNEMDEFEIGNEIEYHNDNTTLTDAEAIAFIANTATDVQAVFTRGPVTYAAGHSDFIRVLWVANGLGGLDFIAPNIYLQYASPSDGDGLQELEAWVGSFGSQMIVREWAVDAVSLTHFSSDWDKISFYTGKMLDRIKELGIDRAYYFCWNDHIGPFGIINGSNGSPSQESLVAYRQQWNNLATNNGKNGRFWFKTFNGTPDPILVSIGDARPLIREDKGYLDFSAIGDGIGPIADAFYTNKWSIFLRTNVRSNGGSSAGRITEDGIGQQIIITGSGAVQILQHGVTITSAAGFFIYNEWHDYAIVYDQNKIYFYRDGHYFDSADITDDPWQSSAPNCYFFNRQAGSRQWDGPVRDFMLYKARALSQREVIALHTGRMSDNVNRFIWWRMNDLSGTTAADSSSNGNDGIVTGGSFSSHSFMKTRPTVADRFLLPTTTQKSLRLTGSPDYFTSPIAPDITGFSCGFWWRPKSFAGENKLFNWESAADRNGINLRQNATTGIIALVGSNASGTVFIITTSKSAPLFRWSYITVTYDSTGAVKVYMNEELIGSGSGVITSNANPFTFGRRAYNAGNFSVGHYKNITFQNTPTAWALDKIKDLYYRNIIPSGAKQWGLNNVATDQNEENALALSGTAYSSEAPLQPRPLL